MNGFLKGIYRIYIDGVLVGEHRNLNPKEGRQYVLNAAVADATPVIDKWYIALFSGNVSPADNWTAANFASNATEIVSTSEGYAGNDRQLYVPDPLQDDILTNSGNKAEFDIVCSAPINVAGAALLSEQTRGSQSGVLLSAVRYDSPYVLNNGAKFAVEFELELSDN